jgi:DNA-binding winged helix-turn-helix (wHTH) protein/cytochrome c-type biogenesis protein CcmH/NrfG
MRATDRIADCMGSIVGKRGTSRLQSDINRTEIAFGPYVFRPDTRHLLRNGEPVTVNGKAFDLLAIFLESGGRVLTREELYERLWGDRVVEEANLSQTIYLLRRALDPDGDGRAFIETIPRIGYRFVQGLREAAMRPSRRRTAFVSVAVASCSVVLAVTVWLPMGRHSVTSTAAHNADELGEYHLALRTPDHLSYALGYFKEAERAAPSDALAYAGAAATYALMAEFETEGSPRRRKLVALALASNADALHREPDFSRALAVQGFIAYRFQSDPAKANLYLERALAADPSDAEAHLWHGTYFMRERSLVAATEEFQTAHRLAPTVEVYSRWLARAYAFRGMADHAIAAAQETLQIRPDDAPAMLTIAEAQEQRGALSSALSTLQALVRRDPYERPFVVPDVARIEVRLRMVDPSLTAHRIGALAAAGQADPFETALLFLTVGHKAAGMRMLYLTSDSALAIQRYDPRLLALL